MHEQLQRVPRWWWPTAMVAWAAAAVASAWRGRLVVEVWGVVAVHPGVSIPAGMAILFAGAWWAARRSRHQMVAEAVVREPRWLWLLTDRGIGAVVLVVAGLGVAAMLVLLNVAGQAAAQPVELAKLRIEAIKYGLGAVAAAGAAAALLLAVRRQRHTESDAVEQRFTELYTAAVEQLGHAEAAVRLGGLYALERVGQNNPEQRQTVVDVICAYLRMPYQRQADDERAPNICGPDTANAAADGLRARPAGVGQNRDPRQERQVRLTAQRILGAHLRVSVDVNGVVAGLDRQFWPDIDLDLAGALLVDFDFAGCCVRTARFDEATFSGRARFGKAIWGGVAQFDGATFSGDVEFDEAKFGGYVGFAGAKFSGAAQFRAAKFGGAAEFVGASFSGPAGFGGAKFSGAAWFGKLTCSGGHAVFDGATFNGDAWFRGATFSRDAWFDRVRVTAGDRLHEWPPGWRLVPDPADPGWLRLTREEDEPGAENAPVPEP